MIFILILLIIGGGAYEVAAIFYIVRFSKRMKIIKTIESQSKFIDKQLAYLDDSYSEIPIEKALPKLGLSIDPLINKKCGMQDE